MTWCRDCLMLHQHAPTKVGGLSHFFIKTKYAEKEKKTRVKIAIADFHRIIFERACCEQKLWRNRRHPNFKPRISHFSHDRRSESLLASVPIELFNKACGSKPTEKYRKMGWVFHLKRNQEIANQNLGFVPTPAHTHLIPSLCWNPHHCWSLHHWNLRRRPPPRPPPPHPWGLPRSLGGKLIDEDEGSKNVSTVEDDSGKVRWCLLHLPSIWFRSGRW